MKRARSISLDASINPRQITNDIPAIDAASPQEHTEMVESSITSKISISDICGDALLKILSYLDPLSLYNLSQTNQFFGNFPEYKTLWEMHLFTHFLITVANTVNMNRLPSACFFMSVSNVYYRGFSNEEKECFTLVRANDLYTIKVRKIEFTIGILNKRDSKDHTLLSLIRKQNNNELNAYVFEQLYEKNCSRDELIKSAIQLNQSDMKVACLLENKSKTDKSRLLHIAIEHNSLSSAELLLICNADLNDTDGEVPHLYFAAEEGRIEMVELLLNYGASIDALHNGNSALFGAAQKGHLEVVQYLIKRGANINLQTSVNNGFPLYIAMQENKTNIVIFLLEKKADVKLKYKGYSVLYIGAKNNHLDGVKALLDHCQQNKINPCINENGSDGSTALYVAAQNGYADMVKLLLDSGANIECEFLGGYTPLYIASQNGHHQVIDVLCRNKPNYNHISPNGSTAIYVAAQNGHIEVVSLLCKQEACNINPVYSTGYTPLYVACQKGHLPVAKILLAHGANINYQTDKGATPLYVAAQKGHKDIVTFLLENEADLNLRFRNGYTPLHIICSENDDYNVLIPIITSLIRAGADPSLLDLSGRTPAMITKNTHVKNILVSLETLSQQDMSLLPNVPCNYAVDTHLVINAINTFIANERREKNELNILTTLCLNLLMDTSTPFGCAVILYSFLDKGKDENKNTTLSIFTSDVTTTKFIQCITDALGFPSKPMAKNFLYSIIVASLGNDKELLEELKERVIQPITSAFNSKTELQPHVYNTIMLCLNLFEAKIKKLILTSALFNDENRDNPCLARGFD